MTRASTVEFATYDIAGWEPPAPDPTARFERLMTAADVVLFLAPGDLDVPDDIRAIANGTARPAISEQVFLPTDSEAGTPTTAKPNPGPIFSHPGETTTHYTNGSLLDLRPHETGALTDAAIATLEAKYPFLDPPANQAELTAATKKFLPETVPRPVASARPVREKEKVITGTEADFSRVFALMDKLFDRRDIDREPGFFASIFS